MKRKREGKSLSPISSDLGIDVNALAGVTQDSRQVEKGFLFAALSGGTFDGKDYISDAVSNGASVILCDEGVSCSDEVQCVSVENPRQVFSHVVSEFYGEQPVYVTAVTGTNGKSSVVHFIDQLLFSLNKESAYIGTLSNVMTTPDPVVLHSTLAQMARDGVQYVALEASSHGLAQYRMDGVRINVAAFTNFTQDHLDYHKDMGDYLDAKQRLFSELLPENGVAVLNADIPEYERLDSMCRMRGVRTVSYGRKGKDIQLLSFSAVEFSQDIEVKVFDQTYKVSLPLAGYFQVMNALCALSCVLAQGETDMDRLVQSLEKLEGVPGRIQHVCDDKSVYHAYVDYAHTPDALENVLKTLRAHCQGRLICVFGCGGDRDQSKREPMAKVVSDLADMAIVTDDNPRTEDPSAIRTAIIEHMTGSFTEISDRRMAIQHAAALMEPEDILLVSGKGHEQGQIFADVTEPFDDVSEVEKALSENVLRKNPKSNCVE